VTTPWGPALDFRHKEVRRFFSDNVLVLACRVSL
jgi:1,4-alpha-glucan branching enzyme